jgi:hypothetical protein
MVKLNFDKELSNVDINKICKAMGIKLNGIYARDDLPSNLKNGNYVINLDSEDGPGTHWCSFIKDDVTIIYFDPFGMPPPQNEVDIFFEDHEVLFYSIKEIQNIDSVVCGYYTIAFFKYMKMLNGDIFKRFMQFVDMFSTKTKKNDAYLKNIINTYYKE